MDEAVIDDLKQFITATVSQHTAGLATKQDITDLDNKLTNRIDELEASIADAIETSNDTVDTQLVDHDQRLTKLEHKPA